jgi:hypothetical protein
LDPVVHRGINKRWQFLCHGSLVVPGCCLVRMAYAEYLHRIFHDLLINYG